MLIEVKAMATYRNSQVVVIEWDGDIYIGERHTGPAMSGGPHVGDVFMHNDEKPDMMFSPPENFSLGLYDVDITPSPYLYHLEQVKWR